MSDVGLHRIKLNKAKGTYTVNFYKNAVLSGTKTVVVNAFCDAEILIKYLDNKGLYRFYKFNSLYEGRDAPKLIGKTNRFVTSILNDVGSESNIGYKNERVLSLTADFVSVEDLNTLQYLYQSPKVYIYLNSKWLEITVINSDNINRRRKNISEPFRIDVQLPEFYNITAL